MSEVKAAISIIIPVYNAEDCLERCLESIVCQRDEVYEIILVDDGSKDSSPDLCDAYALRYPYVKCIHKKNGGVSSARNSGLAVAVGNYVMFVDADDALSSGAISRVKSHIESSDPDFILGSYNIYTNEIYDRFCKAGNGIYINNADQFLEDKLGTEGELFRSPWAKVYKLSIIRDNGLKFNESLSYAEDKLFVYEFLGHISSAASIAEPIYEYYRRSGSLSWGRTDVRRASQIYDMLPEYFNALKALKVRFPNSAKIDEVFHNDLFCGDIMRIFRVFMKFNADFLNKHRVMNLYSMMDADRKYPILENKVPGERIVTILYRSGLHSISVYFYKSMAFFWSVFRS